MAGNTDPVDAVAGLNTTADVSKAGVRSLLKTGMLGQYATAAEVAAGDLSQRYAFFLREYQNIFVRTGDTTTEESEAFVRDANGIGFVAIQATTERVAFSAHKNGTNQTGVATGVATKVTFGTELFDEGGYYDAATSRFTPPSGKYILTLEVAFNANLVDQQPFVAFLYKNGAAHKYKYVEASGTSVAGAGLAIVVEANGTDYFEVYAQANGVGDKTISGLASETWFSGAKTDGMDGLDGTIGEDGRGLDFDARGNFEDRADYDEEDTDFAFLSMDGDGASVTTAVMFFKDSAASADWSDAVLIRGEKGEQGEQGEQGDAGPQGDPGATGSAGATGAAGISGTSALTRVRVAATANVSIATALENGDTLDGVSLATNDLVLLTAQTAPAENGVYVVAASGAAARHTDFDAYDELPGTYFSVMEGTAKADTLWRCTSDRGGTIGATAVAISEATFGGSSSGLTNTRLAKTAAYTLANADKGKTLALGGTALYALQIDAASGFDADYMALIHNTDTTRAKQLLVNAGTSATSFLIGTGSKAFTTQSGLPIRVGHRVRARSAANNANWMSGNVTAYSSTTLTVLIDTVGGSGTLTDWQIDNEILLWPQQSCVLLNDDSTWRLHGRPTRDAARSSITLNVDGTNGSDTNDGLATTTGAFKTIWAAIKAQYKFIDHQGNLPIVSVAGGQTFTESITLTQLGQLTGASTMYLQGSGSAFTWVPASNYGLQFGDNSIIIISNITFDATGTTGKIAISGHQTGVIDINAGVTFGAFPSGYHFYVDTNTKINFNASHTISGSFAYHINITGGSNQVAYNAGATITVTGSPAGATYIRMFGGGSGVTFHPGVTWSGSFTAGMKKYEITGPSSIYLAGLTLPGSVAGTTASGGEAF